jgi:CTP synthase (UTP-ammonia lyase)
MHSAIRVGLVGDWNEEQKAHGSIPKALDRASNGRIEAVWVATDSVGGGKALAEFDGLWCVPGMPYRSADGVLQAIRHARVTHTPFLGTSAGFQYTLIEFARNMLGLPDADHQKTNPAARVPLVSKLDAALVGVRSRVRFTSGTVVRRAYGVAEAVEEYRCSFGLNPRYRRLLTGPLTVSGVDDQDEVRAVELDGHPFFVATLFQPEMNEASPLVGAFVAACARSSQVRAKVAS